MYYCILCVFRVNKSTRKNLFHPVHFVNSLSCYAFFTNNKMTTTKLQTALTFLQPTMSVELTLERKVVLYGVRTIINIAAVEKIYTNITVPTLLDTKNSRTFQDPRSIFQDPVVSQLCLNIVKTAARESGRAL